MKKTAVVLVILAALLIIAYFNFSGGGQTDARGSSYAGSAKCMKCHSNLYKSYLHTAHFIASSPASLKTVHGNFGAGFNVFEVSNTEKVVMEKRQGHLYQTYFINGKAKESGQFDVVLGGIKGESYLYWKGNGLNQLPVSYYTKQSKWLLSPRFAPGYINFNRAITSRCLECHASYIEDQPDKTQTLTVAEQFDKNSLIFSVDCERCHGPAAQHVDFQTDNPGLKKARFITRISTLPRAARLDMCAVCHSGNKSQMLRSTFSFKPGDTLAKFKLPDFANSNSGALDVHGNQLQLLESSKCFMLSKMDCGTCHNTHQNQRGNTALFTQKCIGCHSVGSHNYCKIANEKNANLISSNCIQCHMPALASMAIVSTTADKASFNDILVHTHRIAIYPEQAKKILAMFGK